MTTQTAEKPYEAHPHYKGCPCGRCQPLAAQPAPVPLAYHTCCSATVKIVPALGRYDSEGSQMYTLHAQHLEHCPTLRKEQP